MASDWHKTNILNRLYLLYGLKLAQTVDFTLDSDSVAFGEIPFGDSVAKEIKVFNTSDEEITVSISGLTAPYSLSSNQFAIPAKW